jgi:hypothetical protein
MDRSLFFSEEKNQKTFMSAPAEGYRPWPESGKRRKIKSLLLLFFRKEDLSCLPPKPGQQRHDKRQRRAGQRTEHHVKIEFPGGCSTQECTDGAAKHRKTGRFGQTQSKIHLLTRACSLKKHATPLNTTESARPAYHSGCNLT